MLQSGSQLPPHTRVLTTATPDVVGNFMTIRDEDVSRPSNGYSGVARDGAFTWFSVPRNSRQNFVVLVL